MPNECIFRPALEQPNRRAFAARTAVSASPSGSPRHFHGAPEVPARDRAVRPPPLAALFDLLARGKRALFEGGGEALANSVIIDWKHVWAAEAEDEQHLCRPPADPPHFRQPLDNRLVIHPLDLGQRGQCP